MGIRRHASTAIALSRVPQAPVGPGKYAPVNCTQRSYASNPNDSHTTSSCTLDSRRASRCLPSVFQSIRDPSPCTYSASKEGSRRRGFPARGRAAARRNVASGLGDPGPGFHESPRWWLPALGRLGVFGTWGTHEYLFSCRGSLAMWTC